MPEARWEAATMDNIPTHASTDSGGARGQPRSTAGRQRRGRHGRAPGLNLRWGDPRKIRQPRRVFLGGVAGDRKQLAHLIVERNHHARNRRILEV